MPDPLLYLKAAGASAIVSALVVLATAGVRKSPGTAKLNWACALGIASGLVAGFLVQSLRIAWPPANGLDRFFTIVIPAVLIVELISGIERLPSWIAWFLRMSLAATIPRILLHDSIYLSHSDNDRTPWQNGVELAVSGGLLAALWGLLSGLSRRSPGASIPFALCMSISCAGVSVMLAGYIKGGAAAFPMAAAIMATTIVAWLITFRSGATTQFSSSSILGIAVVGLFGLLFIGRYFGRLSTESALTILLASLACWATEIPLLKHRKPWIVGTLRLVLVAIPLLVVLVLAKREFDRNMAPLLGSATASSGHVEAVSFSASR